MNDDDPSNTRPAGLLSPRRIESIHLAFNKVFSQGIRDGLIRDPSTYMPFDQVFQLSIGNDENTLPVVKQSKPRQELENQSTERDIHTANNDGAFNASVLDNNYTFGGDDGMGIDDIEQSDRENTTEAHPPPHSKEITPIAPSRVEITILSSVSARKRKSSTPLQRSPSPSRQPTVSISPHSAGAQSDLADPYKRRKKRGPDSIVRIRRTKDEIPRIFVCGWKGCPKNYGYLSTLNAHVETSGHGPRRMPEEFPERKNPEFVAIRKAIKERNRREKEEENGNGNGLRRRSGGRTSSSYEDDQEFRPYRLTDVPMERPKTRGKVNVIHSDSESEDDSMLEDDDDEEDVVEEEIIEEDFVESVAEGDDVDDGGGGRLGVKRGAPNRYLDLTPCKTTTLVLQRSIPKRRPKQSIPFLGRKRGRSKRIPVERLWVIKKQQERRGEKMK